MSCSVQFWNSLAPYHSRIENSYLDLASVRRLLPVIHEPVLIVGAGQGMIVAELQNQGLRCDGIDSSTEMVRYARTRRGLDLILGDAKAMPFAPNTYKTIIYATGVVDFMSEEQDIQLMMDEGRRVLDPSGSIYIAFYRLSAATEQFMVRLGLLKSNVLRHREALRIHQLTPNQAIEWVAERTKTSCCPSVALSVWAWAFSTWQEKRNAFHMRRILASKNAEEFIRAVPEVQPYRNAEEIEKLFMRLTIRIKQLQSLDNCFIVKI